MKAVIFDMDGLLIDSEPFWKIAEKKVFGELGLNLNDDLLRQVMGFRLSEVVVHWYQYQPWPNPDFKKTENDVLEYVKKIILENAKPLPGVYEVLEKLKSENYKMAVASSSAMSLIEAVVDKLDIRNYFDVLWSAEFEPFGKPHPGIFITTAQKLNVEAKDCIVFEDSINGVISAKAARMKCIAVPEEATFNDKRFAIADVKLKSLLEYI
ncbi:MAG: hexitol phosphatase HxpB [Bacteroidota bacterium]